MLSRLWREILEQFSQSYHINIKFQPFMSSLHSHFNFLTNIQEHYFVDDFISFYI